MGIVLVIALSSVAFVSLKGGRVLTTLYALELGAGPFETGLLFAVYGLPPFLFAMHAGRIADRLGNHVFLYAGLAGLAASYCVPIAFPSLTALFVAGPLIGITSMLFVVATQNLAGALARPETRARNYSYYSLGESVATVIGPVLVGLLIDHRGYAVAFAVLAGIVAGCVLTFHAGRRWIPPGGERDGARETRSAADLLRLPNMRMALLSNAAVMAGLDFYNVYLPVYARDIGLSATTIGLVIGAFAVAGFIVRMAIPAMTKRWGERFVLAMAMGIAACGFVAIPFTTSAWLIALASFVIGIGLGCGQPLSMLLAFNAAPAGRSAEAIGMRLTVSYGAHVFIPPIFGAFAALVGLAPVFWTCAVVLSGGALLNRRR